MKNFFQTVWATVVGLMIFSVISTVFSLFIFIVFAAGLSAIDNKTVKEKTVIKLDFADQISDKKEENPFAELFGGKEKASQEDVIKAIRQAAKDENVAGILIQARQVQMGLATSEAIRTELVAFRKSGKFIKAFSDVMTEGAYYMATAADEIYVAPEGLVELNGIGGTQAFLKGMFAKLEIEPQIFRVGKFKGAVEPFILDKMSDENRKQTGELLNSVYDTMIADMAKSRGISTTELRAISDSFLVRDNDLALKYKLVDKVAYFDEVEADLKKALKLKEDEKITYMSLDSYRDAAEKPEDEVKDEDKADDNKIAVIYAEGGITTGKSEDGIGSDDLVPLIRKARLDKKVKAVVLRVNSPGGDALASDLIWREITLTNKTKPVIASMGDVAASGGYYIAMGARKIYAQPTTITGSIGVFGMYFNAGPFFTNKMGITFDGERTGKFTDWPNGTRRFTPYEAAMTQKAIDDIYETFTSKAAEGRKMDVNRLKDLAQGRVWSGSMAKQNGLVDELGTLENAITEAAKLAKLKKGEYGIMRMPEAKDFYEDLMKNLMNQDDSEEAKVKAVAKILGPQYARSIELFLHAEKLQGYQARLPFEVEWK
jgi:protease-4